MNITIAVIGRKQEHSPKSMLMMEDIEDNQRKGPLWTGHV